MVILIAMLTLVAVALILLIAIQKGSSMGLSSYESGANSVVGAVGILSKITLVLIFTFVILVGMINHTIHKEKAESIMTEVKK